MLNRDKLSLSGRIQTMRKQKTCTWRFLKFLKTELDPSVCLSKMVGTASFTNSGQRIYAEYQAANW